MPKKLPDRFLKADVDCPCKECSKVKKTCKYCEKCSDHCYCYNQYICSYCEGYLTPMVQAGSEMSKELEECRCENCAGNCGKRVERDEASYLDGSYEPYCDKCYEKVEGK